MGGRRPTFDLLRIDFDFFLFILSFFFLRNCTAPFLGWQPGWGVRTWGEGRQSCRYEPSRLNSSSAEGTPLPGPGSLCVWVCVCVHGLFVCKDQGQKCVCACV